MAHPEDTEAIGRGLQIVRTQADREAQKKKYEAGEFKRGGKAYAEGGMPGGNVAEWEQRRMVHKAFNTGMLKSSVPGRTDKLPISVKSGSYVIPADIVSGIGQGNSDAGNVILSKMFNSGPFGMAPLKHGAAKVGAAAKIGRHRLPKGAKSSFADGGATDQVPIVAAGGEYIIHPDQVADLGNGDMKKGHDILDSFVLHARKQIKKQIGSLKPPKKN